MLHESITLGFNPTVSEDSELRAVFANDTARTLYLLWRQGHIVSQYFNKHVLEIAEKIAKAKPRTVEALARCFQVNSLQAEFVAGDIEAFCPEALPFFTGQRRVLYRLKLKARTADA